MELSAIGQIIPKKLYLRGSLGVMQAKVVEDKENPDRVGIHLNNTSNVTGNLFSVIPRPKTSTAKSA